MPVSESATGTQPAATGAARREHPTFLPELALLTTIVFWSSTFIVTKDAFNQITPMAFIFVRFLLMTVMAFAVLAVVVWRGSEGPLVPRRQDLPRFLASGLSGYFCYQLGYTLGLDRSSVFVAAILIATVPLFTIIFLAIMGERSPLLAWIGMGVAVAGVAVFLLDKRGGERSLAGDALCIFAAVSFAIYGIVNRPLARDYPPASYTAYTMSFGTIPLILAGAPAAIEQDWGRVTTGTWLGIGYMVIFPVYVAYMLWNYGIARRGAAVASSFGLLAPILSGILSAIVFSEQFGVTKVVGGALVLGGLLVIRIAGSSRDSNRQADAEAG